MGNGQWAASRDITTLFSVPADTSPMRPNSPPHFDERLPHVRCQGLSNLPDRVGRRRRGEIAFNPLNHALSLRIYMRRDDDRRRVIW
jgi:hypothetical protein